MTDEQFKSVFNRSSSIEGFGINIKRTSNKNLTLRQTQNFNFNIRSPIRRVSQYVSLNPATTVPKPLTSNFANTKTKIRLQNFQTEKVPSILGISNIQYEPQQHFFPQLITDRLVKPNNYYMIRDDAFIKDRLLQKKQENMDQRYKSIMEYNTQIFADKIFKDLFPKQQQSPIKKTNKVQFN